MSAIIYEKETNGLYPTGQRSVSTFPSGLIRVDQTFVCKTSAAATHRATLAVGANMPGGSTPAIDGLKIFPEPQEKRRDDGFTEFIVSAYGRVNNTGSSKKEHKVGTLGGKRYKSDKVALTRVRKNSETLSIPDINSNISFFSGQINIYEFGTGSTLTTIAGATYTFSGDQMFVIVLGATTQSIGGVGPIKIISLASKKLTLSSYQENNFGDFNEVVMVFDCPDLKSDFSTEGAITVS